MIRLASMFLLFLSVEARANPWPLMQKELERKYVGARIEYAGNENWQLKPESVEAVKSVKLISTDRKGIALFYLYDKETNIGDIRSGVVSIEFRAWVKTYVASKRIQPLELIEAEDFEIQEVDVSRGQESQQYGLFYPGSKPLGSLQARNTILPATPLMLHAIRKIPDLKKGDQVEVRVISSGLTISTSGVAQVNSYLKEVTTVLSVGTKKTMQGVLVSPGVVEVKL